MAGQRRGDCTGRRLERGQVLPITAALVVLTATIAIGVVHVALAATERARAQSAADAAALAGVVGGRADAAAAAAANGARLEVLRTVGDDVFVRVRFRRSTARARARLEPVTDQAGSVPPSSAPGTEGRSRRLTLRVP